MSGLTGIKNRSSDNSKKGTDYVSSLHGISSEIKEVLDQLEEVNRKIAEIEEEADEKQRNDDYSK